jgi:ABC-type uncharacterized transport system substrate-binding protein
MKVNELIKILELYDPNYEVKYYWDSDSRSTVDKVWLNEENKVVLSSEDEAPEYLIGDVDINKP